MICMRTSVSESWINETDTVFCVRSDQDQGERSLKSLRPPPDEAQLNPGLSCRLSKLAEPGPGQIVHNNRHLKQRTVKHCHLQLVIYGSHQLVISLIFGRENIQHAQMSARRVLCRKMQDINLLMLSSVNKFWVYLRFVCWHWFDIIQASFVLEQRNKVCEK